MGSQGDLAANQPSFSIASLARKCVAVAFGSKVIIGRVLVSDDDAPNPLNSVVIEDGQLVRDLAFLHIPDGPVCLVTVGDGKFVNVYNLSSRKGYRQDTFRVSSSSDDEDDGNKAATDNATSKSTTSAEKAAAPRPEATKEHLEAKKWVPAYRYGPHAKRITRVVATDDGAVLFADKFGEVYRLQLSWSPEHTIEPEGDAKAPAEFILQHFSVISKLYISPPVPRLDPVAQSVTKPCTGCRRLFSCDRDRHARVSRYPEADQVEQFLWTRTGDQSVVTSITTVPYLAEAVFTHPGETPAPENKSNKAKNVPYSYYATGYQNGRVSFWAAHNDLPMNAPLESFHCFATFVPEKDLGAVVAIVYLAQDVDAAGEKRHPRDTPRGVAIAYERSRDVVFYPVFDNIGQFGMHAARCGSTAATLPDYPAGMAKSGDGSAAVVLRSGKVAFVQLEEAECLDDVEKYGDRPKLCSFNANIHVIIKVAEQKMPYFEAKIESIVWGGGENQLEKLDLGAQWRSELGRKNEQSGGDDDGDSSDGAGKSPEKKRARSKTK